MGLLKTAKGTVCNICGDVGFEEFLAVCSTCQNHFEHVYCVQTMQDSLPDQWVCEVCKLSCPHSLAFPVLWRGCFNVSKAAKVSGTYADIQAYASSTASLIVSNAILLLPSSIELQAEALPEIYQKCKPTSSMIAVYFFPMDNISYNKFYKQLLGSLSADRLILRAMLDSNDLLILTSHILPRTEQCMEGRHFLWGMFEANMTPGKPIMSPVQMNGAQSSNNKEIDRDINMIGGRDVISGMTPFSPTFSGFNNTLPPLPPGSPPSGHLNGAQNSNNEEIDMDIDMIGGKDVVSGTMFFSPTSLDSYNTLPPLPPGSPPTDPLPPSTPPESIEEGEIVSSPITHSPQQSRVILSEGLSPSFVPSHPVLSPAKPFTPPYSHEYVGSISSSLKLPLTNKHNNQDKNRDTQLSSSIGKLQSLVQEVSVKPVLRNEHVTSTDPLEQLQFQEQHLSFKLSSSTQHFPAENGNQSKNDSSSLRALPEKFQVQTQELLSPHPKKSTVTHPVKYYVISQSKKCRTDQFDKDTTPKNHAPEKKREIDFSGEDLHSFLLKSLNRQLPQKSKSTVSKAAATDASCEGVETLKQLCNSEEMTTVCKTSNDIVVDSGMDEYNVQESSEKAGERCQAMNSINKSVRNDVTTKKQGNMVAAEEIGFDGGEKEGASKSSSQKMQTALLNAGATGEGEGEQCYKEADNLQVPQQEKPDDRCQEKLSKNKSAENDWSKVNQDERVADADVIKKSQIGQHCQVIMVHGHLHHVERNEEQKAKGVGSPEENMADHCMAIKEDASGQSSQMTSVENQFSHGKGQDQVHECEELETTAVGCPNETTMGNDIVMKGDPSGQYCQMPSTKNQLSQGKEDGKVPDINVQVDEVGESEQPETPMIDSDVVREGDTSGQHCHGIENRKSHGKEQGLFIDINVLVDRVGKCELFRTDSRNQIIPKQEQDFQFHIPEDQQGQGHIPIDCIPLPEKRKPFLCLPLLPNVEETVVQDTTGLLIDLVCDDDMHFLPLVDQLDMPWYKDKPLNRFPEPELALAIPQYRKTGNIWISTDSDANCCSDENITLSLSQSYDVV